VSKLTNTSANCAAVCAGCIFQISEVPRNRLGKVARETLKEKLKGMEEAKSSRFGRLHIDSSSGSRALLSQAIRQKAHPSSRSNVFRRSDRVADS